MQCPPRKRQLEGGAHRKVGIHTMAHDAPCAGIEQTEAEPTARTTFQFGKGVLGRAGR